MGLKFKVGHLLWILPLMGVFVLLVAIRQEEYTLNRTVREVFLKLVQVETLSRTTKVDYKVVFWKDHYSVDVYERQTNTWKRFYQSPYGKGIFTRPLDFEFIFSNGRFHTYRSLSKKQKLPSYIIISFHSEGTPKEKRIIFYQKKRDWKVLS